MKKVEKRAVPLKNYFILAVIGIVTIILTLYINEWITSYNEHKISISPLSGKVSEININELEMSLNETPEIILYVSYTNNIDVYNKEVKLLSKLKKENKLDYLIYLDVTKNMENEKYLEILKKRFSNVSNEIKKAPLFIYLKNGEAINVTNSDGRIVDYSDFSQIIETYEIEN